jgi:hypothetical protein
MPCPKNCKTPEANENMSFQAKLLNGIVEYFEILQRFSMGL